MFLENDVNKIGRSFYYNNEKKNNTNTCQSDVKIQSTIYSMQKNH